MSIVRYPLGWERYTGDGFKLASRRGWFFLSVNTRAFLFCAEIWRFGFTVDHSRAGRERKRARTQERIRELKQKNEKKTES